MSFRQKIELENSIFARAEQVQAPVYSRLGKLISPSRDQLLQALLRVYNAFFYQTNWENFCSTESVLNEWERCCALVSHAPVLSKKEYKFELILGGKYGQQHKVST